MTAQASPSVDPGFVDNLTQNFALQFLDRVAASGDREAYRYPRGEAWESVTWRQAGDLVTADGGTLILISSAPEGNSNYPDVPRYAGMDPDLVRKHLLDGTIQDSLQAATGVLWGELQRRIRLVLVSPTLGQVTAEAMGAGYAPTVNAAVEHAVGQLPVGQRKRAVAVIKNAGVVLPIL